MPKLCFCSSWNMQLLGCSKPGLSAVSGQKHTETCGSSACSACWSCLSHLPVHYSDAQGEALAGKPHSSAMLRKQAALRSPSLHSSSCFVWFGLYLYRPVPTYTTIRVVGDRYKSSTQDPRALHPQAGSSCTVIFTSIALSASCHLLSSSSLTFAPWPMPEDLDQISTAEKNNAFNLFIHRSAVHLHCLCVIGKNYPWSLRQNIIFTRHSPIMVWSLAMYAGK